MFKSLGQKMCELKQDESGAFSVKGLTITVAVIVVVGALVTWLAVDGGMRTLILEVWEALGGWLESQIGIGW